jgi:hypothetical protein
MSQFGTAQPAISPGIFFKDDVVAPRFTADSDWVTRAKNGNWIRPGYYLMRLRQYHNQRNRISFFNRSFLSPTQSS